MSLFKEIVNESLLLNEITTNRDNDIKNAINNVLRVKISYDDKKDKVISRAKGKKERYILPVAYGLTKNGKRAIRAYQTAGSTKRGVPKWKLFLLDNIYSWSNGKKSFKEYGKTLINLGLNPKGDKHMTTLFAITPIGNENVSITKNSNPITPNPITKDDVTPTEKLQNPQMANNSNNFTISKNKDDVFVDNSPKNTYSSNKVKSPKTEPILKNDLQPNKETTNDVKQLSPSVEKGIQNYNTEPITKDNVLGQNEKPNNELSTTFKDLTQRMDNLYKDNDEDKT